MAYVLYLFDGLLLPRGIARGHVQDMGTGSAQPSYAQLPGGGFYNTRRRKKAPQGIRPITQDRRLHGTADEIDQQLQALRGKLGKEAELTLRYDNGVLRWQWATLQDVSAPRPSEAKGGWLDISLTWISAAQYWYGTRRGSGWTVGDGSFVLGDGTAVIGANVITFTLPSSSSSHSTPLTHAGTIDALNVRFELDWTNTDGDFLLLNTSTGHLLTYPNNGISSNATLILDCGGHYVFDRDNTTVKSIGSVYRHGSRIDINTTNPHGLSNGQHVQVRGTANFDGFYTDIEVNGTQNLTALAPNLTTDSLPLESSVGTVTRVYRVYNVLDPADKTRWFALRPGSNDVTWTFGNNGSNKTLRVTYYDHYA